MITLELSKADVLALIGICAREQNLCAHTGSEGSATMAYDLREELKLAIRKAGYSDDLPSSPMNDCAL